MKILLINHLPLIGSGSGVYTKNLAKSLKKEGAAKVTHPIKRTNVILKNPNFQIAAKLWDYLYNYTENLNDQDKDEEKEFVIDNLKIKIDALIQYIS